MIEQKYRMNFMKLERTWFTYRRIVAALVGWIALIVFIGGIQQMRMFYAEYMLKKGRAHIVALEKEKEKQIEMARLAGVGTVEQTSQQALSSLLLNAPRWSEVLNQLAMSVPKQLSLETISADKEAQGSLRMSIQGKSTSARVVTDFVMRLEGMQDFKDVELVRTEWKADAHRFEFSVVATIIPKQVM